MNVNCELSLMCLERAKAEYIKNIILLARIRIAIDDERNVEKKFLT